MTTTTTDPISVRRGPEGWAVYVKNEDYDRMARYYCEPTEDRAAAEAGAALAREHLAKWMSWMPV